MQAQIARRGVTSAGNHIRPLTHALDSEINRSTNGITGIFGPPISLKPTQWFLSDLHYEIALDFHPVD